MLLPQLKNMTQQKSSSSGRSLHNFSTLFIDNETILFYIIRYQKKYFCFMFANTRHVGDIGSLKYATTTSKNTDPLVFKITKKLRLMKLLYLISSLLRHVNPAIYERQCIGSSFMYLLIVLLPEVSVLYLAYMCCFGALPTTKNVDTGWVCRTLWQLLPDKRFCRKNKR